jgi:hypothetical protein
MVLKIKFKRNWNEVKANSKELEWSRKFGLLWKQMQTKRSDNNLLFYSTMYHDHSKWVSLQLFPFLFALRCLTFTFTLWNFRSTGNRRPIFTKYSKHLKDDYGNGGCERACEWAVSSFLILHGDFWLLLLCWLLLLLCGTSGAQETGDQFLQNIQSIWRMITEMVTVNEHVNEQ